ncbi:MAG TPA: 1-phosphofructokinase [Candidatus Limnocylindrales bacterium]|jgi:1-phosphofructokinase|nr:1-phosphofructokinase [Candidatus Limnocylindrales bacterium]
MIVTLTLNPSVDRTVEVETLARGEVMRALGVRVDPGGKGINVSRALASHGLPTRAVVAVGGAEGEHLIALLRDTGIEIVAVRIHGAIRSNITVVEPDGTTTKFNEPGAQLSDDELSAVFAAVRSAVESADWLVASGSLPPGMPADVYADLVRSLAGSGTCVAIDTSGPALEAVLAAGPTLVKPNRDELAEVTGKRARTIGDVIEGANRLRDLGAGAVLASLGADGAVLVDADGAIHGRTPAVSPLSSVGAGDAMLAGFLAGGGKGEAALVEGLAWGAAAVLQPGSGMPAPHDIQRGAVQLERHGTQHLDLLAMPP